MRPIPPDSGDRHIIPPEENKCVWMAAGVLSYRLCEREYDCDDCPLDDAMRKHFERGANPREVPGGRHSGRRGPAGAPPGGWPLERDRLYSRRHCWVLDLPEAGGSGARVRIGLEPGLAAALLVPREVVRPKIGEPLRAGQAHAWLVMAGGTLPLSSPLDGTLTRANAALNDRPHKVVSEPFGEGWLFEMEVADAAAGRAGLLTAEAAEPLYAADIGRFRAGLAHAFQPEGAAAPALADGGQVLQDVSEMLGPSKYFALLSKVFG